MNSHLTKQSYKSNVLKLIVFLLYFICHGGYNVAHDLHLISFMRFLCLASGCLLEVMNEWMFLNFDTMCFFICLLKELGSEHAKSHWLHVYIFLQCAFSNVSSNRLSEKRQSHIGCICLTFLQCAFSNASPNCLPEKMHNHIGCIF